MDKESRKSGLILLRKRKTVLIKKDAGSFRILIILWAALTVSFITGCNSPGKVAFPGEKSTFYSYEMFTFDLDGVKCMVVTPESAAQGKPWIWRARFWGHEPQTDIALLAKGFHVAYIDVAGLFGSPKAVTIWDRFYVYLTEIHGFAKKPVLEGMSRGGLIVYNWAEKNPDKVACIYADAPICDIKNWPYGKSSED